MSEKQHANLLLEMKKEINEINSSLLSKQKEIQDHTYKSNEIHSNIKITKTESENILNNMHTSSSNHEEFKQRTQAKMDSLEDEK